MNKPTYINITTILVKSLYILLVLFLFGLFIYISYSGYEQLTFDILSRYNKLQRISEFRAVYLTYERFVIAQIFLCASFLISLFFIKYIFRKASGAFLIIEFIMFYFKRLACIVKVSLFSLSRTEKIVLLSSFILIGSLKYYFLLKFPFHIDEISSYMYFIDKGFLVSASYYPNPNNHIFYSLICCFLKPFFTDPLYLMRIPVLLISMLASLAVFIFIKQYFNYSAALVTYVIFAVSPFLFFYSIHGRGYILMTFFTIFSTLAIFQANKNKFHWTTYVISSVLGFYTMVIYLYPFIALNIFFIINSEKKEISDWKTFIKINLLVFILVITLYIPVFLVSGMNALTSNSWIIKIPFTEFFRYLPVMIEKQFSYISGLDHYYFFISPVILITAIVILLRKKEYKWMILIVCSFLVPLIIVIIQRIQVYERIWTYLIFYQALAAGIVFYYSMNRITEKKSLQQVAAVLVSTIFILFTWNTYRSAVEQGHGVYDGVAQIADYVYDKNAENIYVTEMTYNHYIRYKYHMEKKEIKIDEGIRNLDKKYDFIIIDNKRPSDIKIDSLRFVKAYSNAYADVYELIK